MPDRQSALTPEHRELLRHFVRLIDDMSRSRFIETYRKQDHKISFDAKAEPPITAPEYDWEDFRSFLTMFRQICVSRREIVYVFRIMDIVKPYVSPRMIENMDRMEADLKPLLEGKWEGIRFCRETPTGETEFNLTSFEILDVLINGQIFHADKRHRAAIKFLREVRHWQYIWPLMTEIGTPALEDCIWFFHALREDGILHNADYPEHC